jgi:hypothetical protein
MSQILSPDLGLWNVKNARNMKKNDNNLNNICIFAASYIMSKRHKLVKNNNYKQNIVNNL